MFQALTLVKTCEPVAEMRECRASRDWSLLALQNVRTGKSHYLVICRCPDTNILGKHQMSLHTLNAAVTVAGTMISPRLVKLCTLPDITVSTFTRPSHKRILRYAYFCISVRILTIECSNTVLRILNDHDARICRNIARNGGILM